MCLSIPGKVLSVDGKTAEVDVGGTVTRVQTDLIDDVKAGDYLLVHTGFAIQKYDRKEAKKTLSLLRQVFKDGKFQ
jgi:hydrogenase expression/formation protein HypC